MAAVVGGKEQYRIVRFPMFLDGIAKLAAGFYICPEFFKRAPALRSESVYSPVIVSVIEHDQVMFILFNQLQSLQVAQIMVIVDGIYLQNRLLIFHNSMVLRLKARIHGGKAHRRHRRKHGAQAFR